MVLVGLYCIDSFLNSSNYSLQHVFSTYEKKQDIFRITAILTSSYIDFFLEIMLRVVD